MTDIKRMNAKLDLARETEDQGSAGDTRQRIASMLDKIVSESGLNRIYRFVKYIYIHKEPDQ